MRAAQIETRKGVGAGRAVFLSFTTPAIPAPIFCLCSGEKCELESIGIVGQNIQPSNKINETGLAPTLADRTSECEPRADQCAKE